MILMNSVLALNDLRPDMTHKVDWALEASYSLIMTMMIFMLTVINLSFRRVIFFFFTKSVLSGPK